MNAINANTILGVPAQWSGAASPVRLSCHPTFLSINDCHHHHGHDEQSLFMIFKN
jgi:hypothetical protein